MRLRVLGRRVPAGLPGGRVPGRRGAVPGPTDLARYDPGTDIACFKVRGAAPARSEEQAWGGRIYHDDDGEVVGVEIRWAGEMLPGELLGMLPGGAVG
jgi:uncharacterized protein YuzE